MHNAQCIMHNVQILSGTEEKDKVKYFYDHH